VIFRPTAFLSSTYQDLPFERRFVTNWLKQKGFSVIAHDCADGDDWYRWSLNRAGQCDVYVGMCTQRVGGKGPFGSILNSEYVQADGAFASPVV
jgi:Domain of unknown function (DUF4062)